MITTLLYYRKPNQEELADGYKKNDRIIIKVPAKDVFLGVNDVCAAQFVRSLIGPDGLRYYFKCVNYYEEEIHTEGPVNGR